MKTKPQKSAAKPAIIRIGASKPASKKFLLDCEETSKRPLIVGRSTGSAQATASSKRKLTVEGPVEVVLSKSRKTIR